MSIFLVDYENVNASGMTGLESLTEQDKIYLFYSQNSNKLTFELHKKLCKSKAVVELFEVGAAGQNSLDFQLVSYLGYLIARDRNKEYVIVSRDTGFNSVVTFWSEQDVRILSANNLLKENSKSIAVKLKELLPDYKNDHAQIVQLIEKYKTKQGINNALVKRYGSEKGGAVYKAIRPLISDKKQ
jgi:hypothetical protein